MPCPNPDFVVGRLLLETTLALYISSISQNNIARFFIPKLPYADHECTYNIANLDIKLDLDTKEMVAASLDDEHLTSSETVILLLFYIPSAHHVKVHSMGNWSLNIHTSHKVKNSFHARNSIVTVMYNHMGFTTFQKLMPLWIKIGILSKEWEGETWGQIVLHGVNGGVSSHSLIRELAKHSQLVSFVTLTRSIFLNEFARQKRLFPGCDGEAMFVGTVLHSLEHLMYERILEDPLWVDVNCKRQGTCQVLHKNHNY